MPALATPFRLDAAAARNDPARISLAKSALAWWADAGVSDAIELVPRAWLDRPAPVRRVALAAPAPASPAAAPTLPATAKAPSATRMPDTLPAFREWLATAELPGLGASGRRLVARGSEQADRAVVIAMPGVEDGRAGELGTGPEGRLLAAMLAAAGLSADAVALVPVLPLRVGGQLSVDLAGEWRPIVARHLSLIGAHRLLLLGDGPCRTLLGDVVPRLRTRWQNVNHIAPDVQAVASFDLATLLSQPSCKRLAWDDLLLFTEGPS